MTDSKTLYRGTHFLIGDDGQPFEVSTYENYETGGFVQVNEATGEFRRRAPANPPAELKEGERYRWPEYGAWMKQLAAVR